jgi:hypothetical protein
VDPTNGVTKNPRDQKMEIFGDNFACPNGNCEDIKVRFTHSQNGDVIYMDGNMTE